MVSLFLNVYPEPWGNDPIWRLRINICQMGFPVKSPQPEKWSVKDWVGDVQPSFYASEATDIFMASMRGQEDTSAPLAPRGNWGKFEMVATMGTHVSFNFRCYSPYFLGLKRLFFMVLGSKGSGWKQNSIKSCCGRHVWQVLGVPETCSKFAPENGWLEC